jgi:hypothetical protein
MVKTSLEIKHINREHFFYELGTLNKWEIVSDFDVRRNCHVMKFSCFLHKKSFYMVDTLKGQCMCKSFGNGMPVRAAEDEFK